MPSAIAAHLHGLGLTFEPHFKGDDLGWTGGELRFTVGSSVSLERFLTREDELRHTLNSFAAELELLSFHPAVPRLMQHVIQTQQLIAIRKPIDHADESKLDDLINGICHYYAGLADGIIQADGLGWYDAEGNQLLPEY